MPTDCLSRQKRRRSNETTPVSKKMLSRSAADRSQSEIQRATAADEDKNESERQYIGEFTAPEQFFIPRCTLALRTAVCLRNGTELRKTLEREQNSKDYL